MKKLNLNIKETPSYKMPDTGEVYQTFDAALVNILIRHILGDLGNEDRFSMELRTKIMEKVLDHGDQVFIAYRRWLVHKKLVFPMDLVPKGPHRLVRVSGRWTVAVEHRNQDIGGYVTDLYTFAGTPEALERSQIQELGDYIKLPATVFATNEPEPDPMTDDVESSLTRAVIWRGHHLQRYPNHPINQ